MILRILRKTLFLLFLALPIQTGLHFWPNFSKIDGIRVDYLSPTIHITDLIVIALLILAILYLQKNKFSLRKWINSNSKTFTIFSVFVIALFLSASFSKSVETALYGSVKYVEAIFVGVLVANLIRKDDQKIILGCFASGALFVSILTIMQFYFQSSIGGIFYFFGERIFSSSTPGVAVFSIDNISLLRPYATFAHPNILAFYLLLISVFLLLYQKTQKISKKYIALSGLLLLSAFSLFLTFSRSILALFTIFIGYYGWSFSSKKIKAISILMVALIFGMYLSQYQERFFSTTYLWQDLIYRSDLFNIGLKVYYENLLMGVGSKNFIVYGSEYFHEFSPIFLQPIHNIYLLWLVEQGLIGAVFGLYFLVKSISRAKKIYSLQIDKKRQNFNHAVVIVFYGILIVGFFDHFFLTLQQGLLMGSVVLGLLWRKDLDN